MKNIAIYFGLLFNLFMYNTLIGQNTIIETKEYKIISQFEQINGSTDANGKKEYFALARYKDQYAILLENIVINDYSEKVKEYDLISTTLGIRFHTIEKQGSVSSICSDKIFLKPCDIQPKSNSKGSLIAFELSNEYAFDIKGKYISDITIIQESGNSRSISSIGPSSRSKDFFIRNNAKIESKKGSYDDIEKFKTNKIQLYSLLLLNKADVKTLLGNPVKKSISDNSSQFYRNDTVYHFKNNIGDYEISFKGEVSYFVTFYPKIKIHGSDYYVLKKYLTNKYPFEIESAHILDFTTKPGPGSGGNESKSTSLLYYFKDERIHCVAITSKDRFVNKVEAYVYQDEKILTITKSTKDIFKESIDGTIYSPIEVCNKNGWDYNQSLFSKIRTQFLTVVQNENWSNDCLNVDCSGNIVLNIKWTAIKGSSDIKIIPIVDENKSSCIYGMLEYKLKEVLLDNSRPKIFDEYVNCQDTISAKITETKLSVFSSNSTIKFDNTSIEKSIKDYIETNAQKLRLKDNCTANLKILNFNFEGKSYKIGLIKESQKELGVFELGKAKKKYIY